METNDRTAKLTDDSMTIINILLSVNFLRMSVRRLKYWELRRYDFYTVRKPFINHFPQLEIDEHIIYI